MHDVILPDVLRPKAGASTDGLFLFSYRRANPSPRFRITFRSNLITLLVAGQKKLFSHNQAEVFDPGSCLLFRKGHCLSSDLCPDGGGFHSLLIFFDDAVLSAFKHKYRELLQGLRTNSPTEICLPVTGDGTIEHIKQSLLHSMETPGGLTIRRQQLKFEEILLHLVEREGRRIIDFLDVHDEHDTDELVRRVVGQHARSNLTLEELAFLCHMSLATFKRRFARLFGTSPGRWQRARLLDHAASLLREQRLDPSDVYMQAGYSSLSSFTKSFRDARGVTPKKYQLG